MADAQVIDGKVVRGTPLYRITRELESNPDQEHYTIYAGELRDVAKSLDSKDKAAVFILSATENKIPGEQIRVKAGELKSLINAALGK